MSEQPMGIRWIGGVAVVAIGPNAAGTPVAPNDGLAEVIRDGRGLIFDLIGCELLNSQLLGQMIRVNSAALRAGLRVRVCCPPGSAQTVLMGVRLDRLIPTFSTLAEALAAFDPPVG